MTSNPTFTISYTGNQADDSEIDFYDVAQALMGFQRSLALTTHLVLHGEIITQAPSLRDATIFVHPPEEGSCKTTATILSLMATGIYKVGTAPIDTPLGNFVSSVYDYAIHESLGFHVDYRSTLGQQYENLKKTEQSLPVLQESRVDSLIEKCDSAFKNMHRPIFASETAEAAAIYYKPLSGRERKIGSTFNSHTYDYINITNRSDHAEHFIGKISSYNMNTFKGRIYVLEEHRTIPFELSSSTRASGAAGIIGRSFSTNIEFPGENHLGLVSFHAYRNVSRSGQLKSLFVVEVTDLQISE